MNPAESESGKGLSSLPTPIFVERRRAKRKEHLPGDRLMRTHPLLGIIGTLCGTAAAVWLVPENPVPVGVLKMSGIAMMLGLSLAPAVAMLRAPVSLLRAENLLALALVFWVFLDIVPGAYEMEPISRWAAQKVFLNCGLFVLAMWMGCLYQPWRLPNAVVKISNSDFNGASYFYLGLLAFALGFCRYAIPVNFDIPELIRYLGNMRWDAPWVRPTLGGWDAFLDHMKYFGYLVPMITVLTAQKLGWLNLRAAVLIGCSTIIIVLTSQDGGRRIPGVLMGSGLACWLIANPKVKLWRLGLAALLGLGILVFMQTMYDYRNYGFAALFDPARRAEVQKHEQFRVDDNFLRIAQMTEIIPNEHPHVYHQYPIWVVIRPVPRVFWPGKPVDPGFSLSGYLGRDYVSYSTTVVGELWMAGGYLAVLIGGWLYGRIGHATSQLLSFNMSGHSLVFYSTLLLALFLGVRSGIELVLTCYMALMWICLVWLVQEFGLRMHSLTGAASGGVQSNRKASEPVVQPSKPARNLHRRTRL